MAISSANITVLGVACFHQGLKQNAIPQSFPNMHVNPPFVRTPHPPPPPHTHTHCCQVYTYKSCGWGWHYKVRSARHVCGVAPHWSEHAHEAPEVLHARCLSSHQLHPPIIYKYTIYIYIVNMDVCMKRYGALSTCSLHVAAAP